MTPQNEVSAPAASVHPTRVAFVSDLYGELSSVAPVLNIASNPWPERGFDAPHLRDRFPLRFIEPLHAIAVRHMRAAKVFTERLQAFRLQRKRVVGALAGAVQRDVLFENPCTVGVGDQGHPD